MFAEIKSDAVPKPAAFRPKKNRWKSESPETWVTEKSEIRVPEMTRVIGKVIEKQISQPIFLNTKSKFVLHFQDAVEI